MSRVVDMIWTAVLASWVALRDWLAGLAASPDGWIGPLLALLALVLLLLLILLLRPRPAVSRRPASKPELLVSRGEIRAPADSALTELRLSVSNLGDDLVQLLEVALRTETMPAPETVELSVLIPPGRSVELCEAIDEVSGDEGTLDLYLYAPQARRRAYRLRSRLTWEPWNGRYRVDPLDQRLEPTRRLASSQLQQRQRQEWRRRQHELAGGELLPVAPAEEPSPAPQEPAAEERVPERRERERLEFPSDF